MFQWFKFWWSDVLTYDTKFNGLEEYFVKFVLDRIGYYPIESWSETLCQHNLMHKKLFFKKFVLKSILPNKDVSL